MVAEEYVSYDKYRADLADFRADMAGFREEIRGSLNNMSAQLGNMDVKLAQLEVRLVRWLLVAAAIGGLVVGLIAAVARLVK